MNYLKYCVYILLLVSVASCDEDRFSSTKVIEFPEHESKLAVTSHLSAPDFDPNIIKLPRAYVGNSLGIIDNREYDIIDDATVQLFKDGSLLFDFTYDVNNNIYLGPETPELTTGIYTMEVSAPGYDPVKATQTMPSPSEVVSVSYEFEKVPYDFEEELYDLLKIKIKDPEGEENYYSFQVEFEIKNNSSGQVYTQMTYSFSDDPLFEEGYNVNDIIPDITFDGKNYDIRLLQQSKWYTQNGDDELVAINIKVLTLTKDYYQYETSRSSSDNASGNPFAEPVLVHSNFENGYGVFTLNNVTKYRYEF